MPGDGTHRYVRRKQRCWRPSADTKKPNQLQWHRAHANSQQEKRAGAEAPAKPETWLRAAKGVQSFGNLPAHPWKQPLGCVSQRVQVNLNLYLKDGFVNKPIDRKFSFPRWELSFRTFFLKSWLYERISAEAETGTAHLYFQHTSKALFWGRSRFLLRVAQDLKEG